MLKPVNTLKLNVDGSLGSGSLREGVRWAGSVLRGHTKGEIGESAEGPNQRVLTTPHNSANLLSALGRNRTCGPRFRKPLLSPLSYEGML